MNENFFELQNKRFVKIKTVKNLLLNNITNVFLINCCFFSEYLISKMFTSLAGRWIIIRPSNHLPCVLKTTRNFHCVIALIFYSNEKKVKAQEPSTYKESFYALTSFNKGKQYERICVLYKRWSSWLLVFADWGFSFDCRFDKHDWKHWNHGSVQKVWI